VGEREKDRKRESERERAREGRGLVGAICPSFRLEVFFFFFFLIFITCYAGPRPLSLELSNAIVYEL
jgi:hypothetical protein